jgi:hypothetical protein
MSQTSLFLWNEQLELANVRTLTLCYKITAAKTVQALPLQAATLTAFDAISAQSVIDDFLGTSSEFLLAAFDSTAMGADAFAVIVNMKEQCQELLGMEVACSSGSNGATVVVQGVSASSALTASTLSTECAKGADGNIAARFAFGNTPDFDALTAGLIRVTFYYVSK